MKRLILGGLAAVTLTACTTPTWIDSIEAPAVTTEAEQPEPSIEWTAPTKPDIDWDQAYLDTLDMGDIYYPDDAAAINLGHAICDGYDAGLSTITIGGIATDEGFTPYDAGYIIGAAVSAYCPEYLGEIS